jgi:hypothetical protein
MTGAVYHRSLLIKAERLPTRAAVRKKETACGPTALLTLAMTAAIIAILWSSI